MLDKSRLLSVDSVAYDIEDSVTPSKKAEARQNIRQLLEQPRAEGIGEQGVRINSVESGLALEDLTTVVRYPISLVQRSISNGNFCAAEGTESRCAGYSQS